MPVEDVRRSSKMKSTLKGSRNDPSRSGSGQLSRGRSILQQSGQYKYREALQLVHLTRGHSLTDAEQVPRYSTRTFSASSVISPLTSNHSLWKQDRTFRKSSQRDFLRVQRATIPSEIDRAVCCELIQSRRHPEIIDGHRQKNEVMG